MIVDPVRSFVAEAGRTFASSTLTDEELRIVRAAIGRKRFRFRECYYNAQRILLADASGLLHYVEGYRDSAPHALHAWVAINGKVVDVTARSSAKPPGDANLAEWIARTEPERLLGNLPEGERYVGVEFARSVFRSPHFRLGDNLLDDWEHDWPAQRGVLDEHLAVPTERTRGRTASGLGDGLRAGPPALAVLGIDRESTSRTFSKNVLRAGKHGSAQASAFRAPRKEARAHGENGGPGRSSSS